MQGTILVADDDPDARDLLLLTLSQGNYRVLAASDGVEALKLARDQKPDLLITDIVMPRMDGYELVRTLRQDRAVGGIPVIFCSASYHKHEVREMARSLGVFSTLAKPYECSLVHQLVERAMHQLAIDESALDADTADHYDIAGLRALQERLSALVTFSRELFANVEIDVMARSGVYAARDILLAQCAELTLISTTGVEKLYRASGLNEECLHTLRSSQRYQELHAALRQGESVIYPAPRTAPSLVASVVPSGEFVSMLGVPVASATQTYGHLCIVNRIGLSTFSEDDVDVARAIAAQLGVAYENALRHRMQQEEVAQRQQAEAEVRRLNESLEARVGERTVQLEIANRELEAFSYSVAHDLRAPLRMIHAHVQMLYAEAEAPLPPAAKAHLESIERGAMSMSALIDGLLALSKVSHAELQQVDVSLATLVRTAIAQLKDDIGLRNVEWRIGELPTVQGDPGLLYQVFTNLLGNALKYTGPRAQALIEVAVEESEGRRCLAVRDNGVGFDMNYASKLFGVFQRLHRQDEFDGTGVGLAIVARVIERHGGRVWAESTPGQGTTFRFTLQGLS